MTNTVFTKNKMTRISKISATFKFNRTFEAIMDALMAENTINAKMTAKQISKMVDERMINDQIKKMNEEFETTQAETASTYTETAFTRKAQKPWIAQITGKDAKYGVARNFVKADTQTGDKFAWTLEAGKIYEAFEQVSNAKQYRAFFKIVAGKKVAMTKEQVMALMA